MYIKLLYPIFLLLLVSNSYGQTLLRDLTVPDTTVVLNDTLPVASSMTMTTTSSSSSSGPSSMLPTLNVPSPKATSMLKFGDYPVNLYTGLIDITVPIHTIDIKGLKIPIEFKYHASGIKYDDLDLELGLGWTLMAGGTVLYETRGGRGCSFWVKEADQIDPRGDGQEYNDNYHLRKLAESQSKTICDEDGEDDLYTFSFLNHFGRRSGGLTAPAKPLSFGSSDTIITMSDEDGNRYTFKYYDTDLHAKSKTFHLTRIESVDKADTVIFEYNGWRHLPENAEYRYVLTSTYWIEEITYLTNPGPTNQFNDDFSPIGCQPEAFYPPVLQRIRFRGGKIEFKYTHVRSLDTVKVYNKTKNTPMKIVTLEKSSFTGNGRKLDKVVFRDGNKTALYDYRFFYKNNPYNSSSGVDYWGYYNGATPPYGSRFVPRLEVYSQYRPGSYLIEGLDREANETAMQSGILEKVVYPTKGYTEFTYEAHKARDKTFGGLRIKEIRNYDSNGTLAEKKWYSYANGVAAAYPSIDDFCTSVKTVKGQNLYSVDETIVTRYYGSFPKNSYFKSGSSVVYPGVTEYTGNNSGSIGKTVYRFTHFEDERCYGRVIGLADRLKRSYEWKNGLLSSKTVYNSNGDVVYRFENIYKYINTNENMNLRVLPYVSIESSNNNEIMKNFSTIDYYRWREAIGNSLYDYFNYYFTSGLPVLDYTCEFQDGVEKRTDYLNYNTIGQPTKVSQKESSGAEHITTYTYPTDTTGIIFTTMTNKHILSPVLRQSEFYKSGNTQTTLSHTWNNYSNDWAPPNPNLIAPATVVTKAKGQATAETRVHYHSYDKYGNLTSVSYEGGPKTSYAWGYNGQYPVVKIENADITNEYYEYTDYLGFSEEFKFGRNYPTSRSFTFNHVKSGSSSAIRLSLYANHPTDPDIANASAFRVTYRLTGPQAQTGTLCASLNPVKCSGYTIIDLPNMPSGNYTLMLNTSIDSESDAYEEARVTCSWYDNRTTRDPFWGFFYEGFEDKGTSGNAFAGKKYNHSSYRLSCRMLAGKQYYVDYRYLDNNVWHYQRKEYVHNMLLNEGSAIDEVRVYPVDALMTTYTYDPLVGITSETDPSGRTILYEYDSFGRLIRIKDENGKIMQEYKYNYAGQ